jgi:hypothetical protein
MIKTNQGIETIPISRQIHQVPAIIDLKMIDALRLPFTKNKNTNNIEF